MKQKTIFAITGVAIILFFLIWINLSGECNCDIGQSYHQTFYVNQYRPEEVNSAHVYSINRKSKVVKDSTTLSLIGYDQLKDYPKAPYLYMFNKPLHTHDNWKIILNNKEELIISNIKTIPEENWNMFGPRKRCVIVEWKVNGKLYSTSKGDKFIKVQ